jgi:hypothetical protein
VCLHALSDPVQELHHADLGCARAGIQLVSAKRTAGFTGKRGYRRTLVGLGVEGPRRSSGAGVEEEAAQVRCTGEGGHGDRECLCASEVRVWIPRGRRFVHSH